MAIVVAIAIGWTARGSLSGVSSDLSLPGQDIAKSVGESAVTPSMTEEYDPEAGRSASDGGTASSGATAEDSASTSAKLIIKSGSMQIRIEDMDEAIRSVRELVIATGGEIENLTVSEGGSSYYHYDNKGTYIGTSSSDTSPKTASMTLRIPAEKLAEAQETAATFGSVVSQTTSQYDVTVQHIDMKARLENLIAKEVRLRDHLNSAANVTEILEVERELSRVRGEIESMQAQLTYLENQAGALDAHAVPDRAPARSSSPTGSTGGSRKRSPEASRQRPPSFAGR
jgi:hypothetical protein